MRISETAAATAIQIRRQELHQARSAAMHQTRMEAILFIEESHGIVKMTSKSQTLLEKCSVLLLDSDRCLLTARCHRKWIVSIKTSKMSFGILM